MSVLSSSRSNTNGRRENQHEEGADLSSSSTTTPSSSIAINIDKERNDEGDKNKRSNESSLFQRIVKHLTSPPSSPKTSSIQTPKMKRNHTDPTQTAAADVPSATTIPLSSSSSSRVSPATTPRQPMLRSTSDPLQTPNRGYQHHRWLYERDSHAYDDQWPRPYDEDSKCYQYQYGTATLSLVSGCP